MNNPLERKYGLFTAICMVVGIVIGSGVFFKAQTILTRAGGDMPLGILAWLIGGFIIVAVYLCYYIGVAGGASNQQLIDQGATVAFTNIFGNVLGNILNLFIAISCLGTCNGLTLGCTRGIYALAIRGEGMAPATFS